MTDPTEAYEPPKVEDVSTEAGPAVTAAGDSDTVAISLVDDDEKRRP